MENNGVNIEKAVHTVIEGLRIPLNVEDMGDDMIKPVMDMKIAAYQSIKDLLFNWNSSPDRPSYNTIRGYVDVLIVEGEMVVDDLKEALGREINYQNLKPEDQTKAIKAKNTILNYIHKLSNDIFLLRAQIENDQLSLEEREYKLGWPERFAKGEFYPKENYHKQWHNEGEDAVMICPKGTKGEIIEIDGLKIQLPKVPKKKEILFSDLPKKDQYWRRTPAPEGLTPDSQNNFTAYILEEFRRRREGIWFMNNGTPVYLTGPMYFALQWGKMRDNGGYMAFRYAQRDIFYFAEACIVDPRSLGMHFTKARRTGFTYIILSIMLEAATSTKNANFGMTSQNEDDAQKAFQKLSYMFRNLPFFFRPVVKGSFNSNKVLEFALPDDKSKASKLAQKYSGAEYLNTIVDYEATKDAAYDGQKMQMYLGDECMAPETKIMMGDGSFREIKDVYPGDFVMSGDGSIQQVMDRHEGEDEMFKVIEPHGVDYVVNSRHKLYFEKGGSRDRNKIVTMTPLEYLGMTPHSKRITRAKKFQGFAGTHTKIEIEPVGKGKYVGIQITENTLGENTLVLEGGSITCNSGKWKKPANYLNHWGRISPTFDEGGEIVGKAFIGSTVNPMNQGGQEFKELCYQSFVKDRDPLTERTPSGLYQHFLPAHKNMTVYTDIYGVCHEHIPKGETIVNAKGAVVKNGSVPFLEARRKSKRKKSVISYNEELRANPMDLSEAMRDEAKSALFDIEKINSQLDYLEKDVIIEQFVSTGNFVWMDGIRDTKAVWVPDANGRFKVTWFPPPSMQNNVHIVNGVKHPGNAHIGCFGCDSYDISGTTTGKGSKGSLHGVTGFSMENVPPNFFFMEYINRTGFAEQFYEDVALALHFYGMPILVENNKPRLLYYLKHRGYRGFSLSRPDKANHRLSQTEKELGGIPSSGKDIIITHASFIENYIRNFVGVYDETNQENQVREVGSMGKFYFKETLADWRDFDITKREKHDASISSGYALMGLKRAELSPTPEIKPINMGFIKYNNLSDQSEITTRDV